jgi:hypothetical protein
MPVDVVLNVYDLIEQTPICGGFFHTGVEILGVEYSFGQGGGVYECAPKSAPDGRFRESIVMGQIESTSIARSALDRIRPDFRGDEYSLIFKNCNDFSTAYVRACLGREIPGYINRLARMGRSWPIRCFLPPHLKGNADAGSTTAPLLTTQPSVQLFQGSGNSLTGAETGARKGMWGRFTGGVRRMFRGGNGNAEANTASDTALITDADARELRAAAAARRLTGSESSDPEHGRGGGYSGAPMPNAWG